jgi:hypothetical protein
MADTAAEPTDEGRAAASHYLLRFEVDTLRSRPLWIRLIIEFLASAKRTASSQAGQRSA